MSSFSESCDSNEDIAAGDFDYAISGSFGTTVLPECSESTMDTENYRNSGLTSDNVNMFSASECPDTMIKTGDDASISDSNSRHTVSESTETQMKTTEVDQNDGSTDHLFIISTLSGSSEVTMDTTTDPNNEATSESVSMSNLCGSAETQIKAEGIQHDGLNVDLDAVFNLLEPSGIVMDINTADRHVAVDASPSKSVKMSTECMDTLMKTEDDQQDGSTGDFTCSTLSEQSRITMDIDSDLNDESTTDSFCISILSECTDTSMKTDDDQHGGSTKDSVIVSTLSEPSAIAMDITVYPNEESTTNSINMSSISVSPQTNIKTGDEQHDGSTGNFVTFSSLSEQFRIAMDIDADTNDESILDSIIMSTGSESTAIPLRTVDGQNGGSACDSFTVSTFSEPSGITMDIVAAPNDESTTDSLLSMSNVSESSGILSPMDTASYSSIDSLYSVVKMESNVNPHDESTTGLDSLSTDVMFTVTTIDSSDDQQWFSNIVEFSMDSVDNQNDESYFSSGNIHTGSVVNNMDSEGDQPASENSFSGMLTSSIISETKLNTVDVHNEGSVSDFVYMRKDNKRRKLSSSSSDDSSDDSMTSCRTFIEHTSSTNDESNGYSPLSSRRTSIEHPISSSSEDPGEESSRSRDDNRNRPVSSTVSAHSYIGMLTSNIFGTKSGPVDVHIDKSASDFVDMPTGTALTVSTTDSVEDQQSSASSFVRKHAFLDIRHRTTSETVDDQHDIPASGLVSAHSIPETTDATVDIQHAASGTNSEHNLSESTGTISDIYVDQLYELTCFVGPTSKADRNMESADDFSNKSESREPSPTGCRRKYDHTSEGLKSLARSMMMCLPLSSCACGSDDKRRKRSSSSSDDSSDDSTSSYRTFIVHSSSINDDSNENSPSPSRRASIEHPSSSSEDSGDESSSRSKNDFRNRPIQGTPQKELSETVQDFASNPVSKKPSPIGGRRKSKDYTSDGLKPSKRSMFRCLTLPFCVGGSDDKRKLSSSSSDDSSDDSTSSCRTFIEQSLSTNDECNGDSPFYGRRTSIENPSTSPSEDSGEESSYRSRPEKSILGTVLDLMISEHLSSSSSENFGEESSSRPEKSILETVRDLTISEHLSSSSGKDSGEESSRPEKCILETVQDLTISLIKPLTKLNCDIAYLNIQTVLMEYTTRCYENNHMDSIMRGLMEEYERKLEVKRENLFKFLDVPAYCRLKQHVEVLKRVLRSYQLLHSKLMGTKESMLVDQHYLQTIFADSSNDQLSLDLVGEISNALETINYRMGELSTWMLENAKKYELFFKSKDQVMDYLDKF